MIYKLQLLYLQKFVDNETQTEECAGCKSLLTKKQTNKRLRSSLKSAKFKLSKERLAHMTDEGI